MTEDGQTVGRTDGQTDGQPNEQTDGRTDRIDISISRVSVLTRDKNRNVQHTKTVRTVTLKNNKIYIYIYIIYYLHYYCSKDRWECCCSRPKQETQLS